MLVRRSSIELPTKLRPGWIENIRDRNLIRVRILGETDSPRHSRCSCTYKNGELVGLIRRHNQRLWETHLRRVIETGNFGRLARPVEC